MATITIAHTSIISILLSSAFFTGNRSECLLFKLTALGLLADT
jgi:hypothetical protein